MHVISPTFTAAWLGGQLVSAPFVSPLSLCEPIDRLSVPPLAQGFGTVLCPLQVLPE